MVERLTNSFRNLPHQFFTTATFKHGETCDILTIPIRLGVFRLLVIANVPNEEAILEAEKENRKVKTRVYVKYGAAPLHDESNYDDNNEEGYIVQ